MPKSPLSPEIRLDRVDMLFIQNLMLLHPDVAKWIQFQGVKPHSYGVTLVFKSSQHSIYFECLLSIHKDERDDIYQELSFKFQEVYQHFRTLKYSKI
jgi:hypothetical protein